jgi:SAM-dependent methyltransferase
MSGGHWFRAQRWVRDLVAPIASRIAPARWKELNEWEYWRRQQRVEGTLTNDHYYPFYTTHFGLSDTSYTDQVILDLGCGPRGSLEWAHMARRRIGLDPLANRYRAMNGGAHRMEYIQAAAEQIPLPDGACDALFSFNSLDHVGNVEQTMAEIARVTRPGGLFLLLVEVNHPPTNTEPHRLTPDGLIAAAAQAFRCERPQMFAPEASGMYESIRRGRQIDRARWSEANGYFSAMFIRR